MKKLFCSILLVLFVQIINAQTWGIKGGINFAEVSFSGGDEMFSPSHITGFHVGPVADFKLIDKLHFNPGLLYSLKGYKESYTEENLTEKINCLVLPLNLSYRFPINPVVNKLDVFAQAGPYLSYALSGKSTYNGETTNIDFDKENMKRFDFGVDLGAGVQYGPVVVSLNYELGLTNLSKDGELSGKVKNKVFQISAAIMFGKKK